MIFHQKGNISDLMRSVTTQVFEQVPGAIRTGLAMSAVPEWCTAGA